MRPDDSGAQSGTGHGIFGNYRGTFTRTGFFWVNPFYSKKKVSLRARNINVDPIKVNDRNGNPILVGLILVWKVEDVYKAIFEIDTQTMAASLSAKGKKGENGEAGVSVADSNAGRMTASSPSSASKATPPSARWPATMPTTPSVRRPPRP